MAQCSLLKLNQKVKKYGGKKGREIFCEKGIFDEFRHFDFSILVQLYQGF